MRSQVCLISESLNSYHSGTRMDTKDGNLLKFSSVFIQRNNKIHLNCSLIHEVSTWALLTEILCLAVKML